jgi:hypothetical protein
VAAVTLVPLEGIPEVGPGDDLSAFLGKAIDRAGGLASRRATTSR